MVAQTVNKATPTVALVSSVNSSLPESAVTFTAAVSSAVGTPSGSVSFYDGTTLLGSGTVAQGVAAYTTSSLTVGAHSITAVYSGDAIFVSVTSSAVAETVNKATPTVSLVSSVNPVLVTNAVTFTATVSSTAGTPSGSVAFYDGATLLGPAVGLAHGAAAYATSSLAMGVHSITAVYTGDATFVSVTSSAVAQTLEDFTVSAGSSPTETVAPGGTATYTLALGPSGGTTFPSAVTLTISGLPAGATATLNPQTLPAGSDLTNVELSIQLPAAMAALKLIRPITPLGRGLALAMMGGIFLLPLGSRLGGKMRCSAGRAGKLGCLLLLGLAATCATLGLTACGGGGSGYFVHPLQSYTVSVTATSGALSHSTIVNLTVK